MTQGTKKDIERFYIELLRQQIIDIPPERPDDGERPDFIWSNLVEPLGVEITRLFKNVPEGQRPMQVQESESNETVKLALQIYEKQNLPNLDIRVIFGSRNIKKSDRLPLAKQLIDAVQKNLPSQNNCTTLHNDFNNNSVLSDDISYLSIARFDSLTKNHWSVSGDGWVQDDFNDVLQKRISAKNKELPEYLKRCSKCWLLVVADGSAPSSFFEPNEHTKQHLYHSLFHRTFFMEAFNRSIIELNTSTNGT